VVSAQGGILGLGAKKVVIPLSNLAMQNNKLIDQSVVNAEQLKQQQAYNEDLYTEVSSDQNLSEFSAFEPHQSGGSQSSSTGASSFHSQGNQGQSNQ
jgi:hypothetical protein